MRARCLMVKLLFQPTLPQRERPMAIPLSDTSNYFNPRSHKGSDLRAIWCQINEPILQYFNPRSHKGSDCLPPLRRGCNRISTHAPTKGATGDGNVNLQDLGISTHAPTKGATCRRQNTAFTRGHFNPRSHKGSDQKLF